ncbi:hypothetical protein C8J57DRAFT_1305802 [Mycena rebaudengoi]|nr:hypothetical protein C8J57DRAFT_1305802 [Mycena rebaudengoi]
MFSFYGVFSVAYLFLLSYFPYVIGKFVHVALFENCAEGIRHLSLLGEHTFAVPWMPVSFSGTQHGKLPIV